MSYEIEPDLLLTCLRIAVNHDHLRRRRQARIALAVSTLVLLIGATVASAATAHWWRNPRPDIAKATPLVETTLRYPYNRIAAGTKIVLWTAPNQSGGSCLVVGRATAGLHWGPRSHPAECRQHGIYQPTGDPMTVGVGSVLSDGLYEHLIEGSVDPTSGIVKVALQEASGPRTTLAFHNGWFLGDVRPTKTFSIADAYLIGFDADGHEVARVRLPS
jgi:hypothetical protein